MQAVQRRGVRVAAAAPRRAAALQLGREYDYMRRLRTDYGGVQHLRWTG